MYNHGKEYKFVMKHGGSSRQPTGFKLTKPETNSKDL